jgi:transcriptional regulator GlxA family with amidase domain
MAYTDLDRTERGEEGCRVSPSFRLGVYVFEEVELLDFAAPCGVLSLAAHFNPRLEVALLAEELSPVRVREGVTLLPSGSLEESGPIDGLLLPGGVGSRREMHNPRLHRFIRGLPDDTLIASVCSGALILGRMGLLDGRVATSRKEPDPGEFSFARASLLDELSRVAPDAHMSRARLVDNGRIITSGGAASGLELGFHLLRRAGHSEAFISEVARVMDYTLCHEMYMDDLHTVVS